MQLNKMLGFKFFIKMYITFINVLFPLEPIGIIQ